MTDRITQCDVVDCCEDCPRYADDCDGDKYLDRYPTMHEYAEGKRINPKLRDLISRADVYKAHEEEHLNIMNRIKELQYAIAKTQTIVGEMVESAEVEPTVIRSKTLMPTKDFKEWAKRVRETNPNVIVIPCDAEVVSAEAEWIPCSDRLPEDIRPVLVTWKNIDPASYYQYIVGKHFIGTAHYYRGKWYWYSSTTEDMLAEYGRYDFEEFDEAIECIAWMPLPTPYKGGDTE